MNKRAVALILFAFALSAALAGCVSQANNPQAWKANFAGVWELNGATTDGEDLTDEQVAAMKEDGRDVFIMLRENNTCSMLVFGLYSGTGTWEAVSPREAHLTFSVNPTEEEEEEGDDNANAKGKDSKKKKKKQEKPEETYDVVVNLVNNRLSTKIKNSTLRFGKATKAEMDAERLQAERNASRRKVTGTLPDLFR